MGLGIFYGLLAQVAFIGGYIFINRSVSVSNATTKIFLVLGMAGTIALISTGIMASTGTFSFQSIPKRHWLFLFMGAMLTMIIGQLLYMKGIERIGIATISYTALAYPLIALFTESLLGNYTLSWRDAVGFVLLAAGFLVVTSGPAK